MVVVTVAEQCSSNLAVVEVESIVVHVLCKGVCRLYHNTLKSFYQAKYLGLSKCTILGPFMQCKTGNLNVKDALFRSSVQCREISSSAPAYHVRNTGIDTQILHTFLSM